MDASMNFREKPRADSVQPFLKTHNGVQDIATWHDDKCFFLLDNNIVAELTLCRVCCSAREEQRSTRLLTREPVLN